MSREAAASWEAFDGYLSRSSLLTSDGIQVARKALALLRNALQPVPAEGFFDEWPEIPPEIWASPYYVQAFAELLEIGLRVDALSDAEGIDDLLERIRQRPLAKDWRHASLQLEVAALAAAVGYDVGFEPRMESGGRADLILLRGHHECVVEVSRIALDRDARAADRFSTAVFDRLMSVELRFGIIWRVELAEIAPPKVTEEWFSRIEAAAASLGEDEVVIEGPPGRVLLSRRPLAHREPRLAGVATQANEWERIATRLKKKIYQVAGGRGAWVRIDVVSGLWQLTEWATKSLPEKLQDIAPLIRDLANASPPIDGVAISSGLLRAQTPFVDEDASLNDGSRMLRRTLEPSRVREIVVVPLRPGVQATFFTEMYEAEPEWLDGEFRRRGLPPLSALLIGRRSGPR